MKVVAPLWALVGGLIFAAGTASADLTIIQKIESAGSPNEMTIKVKGDKVRLEASPQVTMIYDGKTGEMATLMNDEKRAVRLSAERMKAAAEMVKKFSPKEESAEKPKFIATGKKETVNGFETEQYRYDGADFKATYWIALNYPNGPEILKQLQSIKSDAWSAANARMPDYHELPGIPIRTRMVVKSEGDSGKSEITSTIVSIKTDPLNDAEFSVPGDFKEMEIPDIFGGQRKPPAPAQSPGR